MHVSARVYVYIYICVFICAYACRSKLYMHVNNVRFSLLATPLACVHQLCSAHYVGDLCHSAFNFLKGCYISHTLDATHLNVT